MLCHVRFFAILWTVACQTPLFKGLSRQEYWSGLPFPSPGDLSDSEIEPTSPVLPEKAMAPHSSTLAWKIPWTEEPGRLQFMGSLRVKHDWATSLSLFTFMHWRRKWQPTPVFLPGESRGRGSLVGCRLWGRTESDTTEATQQQQQQLLHCQADSLPLSHQRSHYMLLHITMFYYNIKYYNLMLLNV